MSFGVGVGDCITVLQLANRVRQRFVDAPTQFKAIHEDIKILSNVLRDIDDFVTQQDLDDQKGLEVAQGCAKVLEDLEETLDKYQELDPSTKRKGKTEKTRRIWKRIQFDQTEIDRHRSRITLNIGALNTFLARITGDTSLATKHGVDRLNRRQDDQLRHEIAEWLTQTNYVIQQTDLISKVQPETGLWLLNSNEFDVWMAEGKKTLFCPGIPGAGKTMITAIVVNNLMTRFRDDHTTGVAYIYCNFRRQYEQKPIDLLLSILRQLFQKRPSISESVKRLYERYKGDKSRPSLPEILEVLYDVISECSRNFIIIDALDECQINTRDRKKFLSELFNLQARTGVNVFATSRFIPDIMKEFEGSIVVEISASEADIERFIDDKMNDPPQFVLRSPSLQEEIKITISNAVSGMFLLAHLYMDSLSDKTKPKDLRSALESFREESKASGENQKSKALERAYEDAMDRIDKQKEGLKKLSTQILSWITCARRPLTTLELRHALAIEIGSSELDEENLNATEDLVAVCAGLVTVDEESSIIRLVHYTTQEYFERTWTTYFPSAQVDITTACMTYLSFTTFETGFCLTDKDFESRLRLNPLYSYAAQNWGYHARPAFEDARQAVLGFLQNEPKVSSAGQALMASSRSSSGYSQRVPKQVTALHLAGYFGLTEAIMALLEKGYHPDVKDKNGRTPLSWAAEEGNTEVVTLLLGKGDHVDPDSKDNRGRTPFSLAAERGCEEVLKILLGSQRVDANCRDKYGRTPLSWAVEKGRETTVKLLLSFNTTELNCKDRYGRTALLWAVEKSSRALMKLLLDRKDIDIECRDKMGRTPLLLAVERAKHAAVELLLFQNYIDLDCKDKHGRNPLSKAVETGSTNLVRLLLENDRVDKNSKDEDGTTPIMWAVRTGHNAVINLLLNHKDIDATCKTKNHETLLHEAARRGNYEAVDQLLKRDQIYHDSKNILGDTPLIVAAEEGHVAVAKLLIDAGCDPNYRGCYDRAPLFYASKYGHESLSKMLLSIPSVNPNVKDSSQETPLARAIEEHRFGIITMLLEHDKIDPYGTGLNGYPVLESAITAKNNVAGKLLLDKMGFDPKANNPEIQEGLVRCLHTGSLFGNAEIVKLLLDKGIDPNLVEHHGRTALMTAVERGHEKVVEVLLAKGANAMDSRGVGVSYQDLLFEAVRYKHAAVARTLLRMTKVDLSSRGGLYKETPLVTAVRRDDWEMAEMLIDEGADVNKSDKDGRTPLSLAAESSNMCMVKLLIERTGNDADREDEAGRTPLTWAAEKGNVDSVKLLLDSETIDPNSDLCEGRTPLSWAAGKGHETVVRLFLAYEVVNPDTKDFEGRTPLWWAAKNGHTAVVNMLRSHGCLG